MGLPPRGLSAADSGLSVAGVMSGTSLDGVDVSLVQIQGWDEETRVRLIRYDTIAYDADARAGLLKLCNGIGEVADVALWHQKLGGIYAEAVRRVVQAGEIDLIGCHGQTICHLPASRATLQIGSAAALAERTGVTVVSDFRQADVAAGGEGAPLVPFADWALLRHPTLSRVALNIGGIANVTYLRAGCRLQDVRAFDTGPGNAPIDAAVRILRGDLQTRDTNGALAAAGSIDHDLVAGLLAHPYFSRSGPRTTGQEEFGQEFAAQVVREASRRGLTEEDILAAITALVARSISHGIQTFPTVDEVVVSGGGWHNQTLMEWLRVELDPVAVLSSSERGIPVDGKEAIAFAILANQTIRGLPSNIPACTGALRPAVLGSVTPATNFRSLMERLWT